jgi:hypothetical protein
MFKNIHIKKDTFNTTNNNIILILGVTSTINSI